MRTHLFLLLVCLSAQACSHQVRRPEPQALPSEALVLGGFEDDYGIHYTISRAEWVQHPRARYHIVEWHADELYLVARNDVGNPSDGGLWTRIDWLALSGMPPYTWAFCLSAYKAKSREAAGSTRIARRETPRTGCNGHPFSRMRPSDR